MIKIRVELGDRSYPILVGEGLLARAGPILRNLGFRTSPTVVTNNHILRLHGQVLLPSLEKSFGPSAVIRIGDGERFKNQVSLTRIYGGLLLSRADRGSWILALGGGVVGDTAGFAAATYMRGIQFVSVPTTLLAQVDSSVGGKVGINLPGGKNLVGAFHQPRAVLSDTATLRSLPARELAAGLYEVLKCGAIRSKALVGYLEKNLAVILSCEARALAHVIAEAVRIKAAVVESDEREGNARMILNYGHTVGHALEAATEYRRFKHGEAVAWGMIAAARLGLELGMLRHNEAERLIQLTHRIERLPSLHGVPAAGAWHALRRDKKSRDGKIRFVLLRGIGHPEIVDDLDHNLVRRFIFDFLGTGDGLR
jgi:3-dehydroquinate synthase